MNRKLPLLLIGSASAWVVCQWIAPTFSRQVMSQKPLRATLTQPLISTQGKVKKPLPSKGMAVKSVNSRTPQSPISEEKLQLLEPVPGLPPNSAMKISVIDPVAGQLVCTYFGYHQPYTTALVLSKIEGGASNSSVSHESPTQETVNLTYPVKKDAPNSNEVVSGARFSPDGRYVLFKSVEIGLGIKPAHLYVLDIQTNAVTAIPINIGYRVVSWSPDSQYIACVEGGDADGNAYITLGPETIYVPMSLYVCNWRTGKTQLVVANDTIGGPFSWVAPHTLIYGILSSRPELC